MKGICNAADRRGFTLVELMIVVAVVAVLAAVGIPKFASLINNSREGATKGGLGSVRSALVVYFGETEGTYPTDELACLAPRYLNEMPTAKIPQHATDSNAVHGDSTSTFVNGSGGWAYANVSSETGWGTFVVNCTKNDSKGIVWSTE